VTNLEMTAAYNAIAAGGIYTEPYCYTRVLDRQGNVLLENGIIRRRVLSAETAALLTLACENVIDGGSGQQAYFEGMALAGKSGTTTGMRDVWFVGYTPYYTCGVWGGYDDYSPQENSAYVKTVWKAVMRRAHEETADTDFAFDCRLTEAEICTKCGELAALGVCEDTVQGDMSRVEYFAPGTEPTLVCTCHVQRDYCRASGKRASYYCPDRLCETEVYLRYGTDGTMDAAAVLPDETEVCDLHTSIWDKYFSIRQPEEPAPEPAEPVPEEPTETRPWWHYENWWPWR
jgi:penicillin-binding protein 1A